MMNALQQSSNHRDQLDARASEREKVNKRERRVKTPKKLGSFIKFYVSTVFCVPSCRSLRSRSTLLCAIHSWQSVNHRPEAAPLYLSLSLLSLHYFSIFSVSVCAGCAFKKNIHKI
jgi:hypothetical protein